MTVQEKIELVREALLAVDEMRWVAMRNAQGKGDGLDARRVQSVLQVAVDKLRRLQDELALEVVDDFADLDGLDDLDAV